MSDPQTPEVLDAAAPPPATVQYGISEQAIAETRERYAALTFDTPENYEIGRKALAEVRTTRTGIEKRRKELKEGILEEGRKIDATAKHLTALLEAIEKPLAEKKKTVDDAKEAEKRAEEARRLAAIEEEIRANRAREEAELAAAREQAERESRERIAAEQERARIAREAEEARMAEERRQLAVREAALAEERERLRKEQEAQRIAEDRRLAAEREALAEERRRLDQERAEREAAEAQRERERRERERVEAEARAEEERRQEAARAAEREAAEAEAREAQRLEEVRLAAEAEERAALQRRLDEAEREAHMAAIVPVAKELRSLAAKVRAIKTPVVPAGFAMKVVTNAMETLAAVADTIEAAVSDAEARAAGKATP